MKQIFFIQIYYFIIKNNIIILYYLIYRGGKVMKSVSYTDLLPQLHTQLHIYHIITCKSSLV